MQQSSVKLFNKNFILSSIANFLLFLGFYLVMPIMAKYVMEVFKADAATAGIVTSVYVITALLTRPLSGFMVDSFDRKKFFLLTYTIFTLLFFGYIAAQTVLALIIVRIFFGFVFSCTTTVSSTIAIDVMPSERRGEGIGYFGSTSVLSMAVGPMIGLYLLESFSYTVLFSTSILSCTIGLICASLIKTRHREPVKHAQAISLDRFILKEGLSIVLVLALVYFLYGMFSVYIPQYLNEIGLDIKAGNFFLVYAVGIIFSRLLGGGMANKGYHNALVLISMACLIIGAVLFLYCLYIPTVYAAALALGLGFGFISPTIQTMIINLVSHSRRGTANSTYFIAMDLGSGAGMLLGGFIASSTNFHTVFQYGLSTVIISLFVYLLYSKKSYFKKLESIKL